MTPVLLLLLLLLYPRVSCTGSHVVPAENKTNTHQQQHTGVPQEALPAKVCCRNIISHGENRHTTVLCQCNHMMMTEQHHNNSRRRMRYIDSISGASREQHTVYVGEHSPRMYAATSIICDEGIIMMEQHINTTDIADAVERWKAYTSRGFEMYREQKTLQAGKVVHLWCACLSYTEYRLQLDSSTYSSSRDTRLTRAIGYSIEARRPLYYHYQRRQPIAGLRRCLWVSIPCAAAGLLLYFAHAGLHLKYQKEPFSPQKKKSPGPEGLIASTALTG